MTYKEIEDFIKTNKIERRIDLQRDYSNVFCYFSKLNKEEKDKLLPSKYSEKHNYGTSFSTVEDFQKFIDSNNIIRPVMFRRNYPKIYDRLCRILSKEEKQRLIYQTRVRSYSDIDTIDLLQDFIDANEVHSRKELHKRFPGLYVKFTGQLDSVTFKSNNMSVGENFLSRLLNENNIKFETQKIYPELKNITYLRFDFYLPDYNILIEHQGEEHFGKGKFYTENVTKNDKLKYDYAITNGIPILYYTIYKGDYKKLGYFTEVITDADILIQKIKEIGLTTQSNS